MKPVYKCDYCDYMNTEDKVREHEITCTENYDRKSCYTCVHKKISCRHNIPEDKMTWIYNCEIGKEIPEGKIYEFCPQYERKETSDNPLVDLFGDIFGGTKR